MYGNCTKKTALSEFSNKNTFTNPFFTSDQKEKKSILKLSNPDMISEKKCHLLSYRPFKISLIYNSILYNHNYLAIFKNKKKIKKIHKG